MLRRGFVKVSDPADGPDLLWAPGIDERPIKYSVPAEFMHGGSWRSIVPVAYDDPESDVVVRLHDRRCEPGDEISRPTAVERLCPPPTADHYLDGADSVTMRRWLSVDDPVVLAFAMRLTQVTPYEAQTIVRAARGSVSADLCDAVLRAGPGMEHSPDFVDLALAHLPREALDSGGRRLMAAIGAAPMLLRQTGVRSRVLHRANEDELRAVLAPFVAVCGPIPSIDVPHVASAETPRIVAAPSPRAVRAYRDEGTRIRLAGGAWRPQTGDVVASAPDTVLVSDVALARGCTHHRVLAVTDGSRGEVFVALEPALPADGDSAVVVVAVDDCRDYLVERPESAADPVPVVGSSPARAGADAVPRRRLRWWSRTRAARGDAASGLLWEAALAEHDRVRREYLAYEMEPELILRYPSVTDVAVDETAMFLDAVAEADALRTDGPVDESHATAYRRAVSSLARSWTVCEDSGRRRGHSLLPREDAADLDTAVKLLRHAVSSSTEIERAVYLERAQTIVDGVACRNRVKFTPRSRDRLAMLSVAALPGP
ncbi:hypothetical protein L5G32_11115 [Gordonia sp. HY002]|uniref:hypothetical protein n=1 Tax=Gordonia zhenghanii TaxID=2911516 RepID=UPI001EF0C1C5|nr:hypothetical protein [Gordonia zhenghanii]MCF8570818.1 hypothetical protein [Gordonia zhenghanii]MCF8605318.1 hypothetical protein [Gordonia zhenghanii]